MRGGSLHTDLEYDNERYCQSVSQAHSDSVLQMRINPFCPRVFATVGKDGAVKVWHFVQATGEPALQLDELLKIDQGTLDSKYPILSPDESQLDKVIEEDMRMDPPYWCQAGLAVGTGVAATSVTWVSRCELAVGLQSG